MKTIDRVNAIRERNEEQVEVIKATVSAELSRRIGEAKGLVSRLEAAYADMTDAAITAQRVSHRANGRKRGLLRSEVALEKVLKKYNGKANRQAINAEGFKLRSAITIAKSNDKKFGFRQNGPQGEVWLK